MKHPAELSVGYGGENVRRGMYALVWAFPAEDPKLSSYSFLAYYNGKKIKDVDNLKTLEAAVNGLKSLWFNPRYQNTKTYIPHFFIKKFDLSGGFGNAYSVYSRKIPKKNELPKDFLSGVKTLAGRAMREGDHE